MDFLQEIQKLNPYSTVNLLLDNECYTLYINDLKIKTFSKSIDLQEYVFEQLKIKIATEKSCEIGDISVVALGTWTLKIKDEQIHHRTFNVSETYYEGKIRTMTEYLNSCKHYSIFYGTYGYGISSIVEEINKHMKMYKLQTETIVFYNTGLVCNVNGSHIVTSQMTEGQIFVNDWDKKQYQFRNGKLNSYDEEKKFDSKQPFTIYETIENWKSLQNFNTQQIITMNDAKFHYVENKMIVQSHVLANNLVICHIDGNNSCFIVLDSKLKRIADLKYIVVENDQIDIPQLFTFYPGKFDAIVKFDGSIYTKYGAVVMSQFDKCNDLMKNFEFTNVYTQKKYDFVVGKSCTRIEHHPDIYQYVEVKLNSPELISYFNENFGKMKYVVSKNTFSSIFKQNTTCNVGFEFLDSLSNQRMKVGENGLIEVMSVVIQSMEFRLKNIEEKLNTLVTALAKMN